MATNHHLECGSSEGRGDEQIVGRARQCSHEQEACHVWHVRRDAVVETLQSDADKYRAGHADGADRDSKGGQATTIWK